MTRIQSTLFCLLLGLQIAYANVEKIVFLAPRAPQIPPQHPTSGDPQLEVLSPQFRTRRTKFRAEFPTDLYPKGFNSWVLLDNLTEGQRYEFRVCWAGTQPSLFKLNVFSITEAFQDSELVAALATYSQTRQALDGSIEYLNRSIFETFEDSYDKSHQSKSVALVQIFAVADYFTTNQSLMDQVPLVLVDITLDPYLLNVYPESLIRTGIYLVTIATGSWYIACFVVKWLKAVARTDEAKKDAMQGKDA